MPSYDFVCKECCHQFSVFCSISSRDKQICPQCSSTNISQRFTSINIGTGKGSNTGSSLGSSGFG